MPRDIGPPTTYQSLAVEATDGLVEDNVKGSTLEPEKSEVVQKLETLAELSDNPSPPHTPKTPKSNTD